MTADVTAQVVAWITDIGHERIPEIAREEARRMLLDATAVFLAGIREPSGLAAIVTRWAEEQGGLEEASIIGAQRRVPAMSASFVNGTIAHACDFDNITVPLNHAMSPVLPPVLALAESYGLSGAEVLAAVVVGVEMQGRTRRAAKGLDTGVGFHKPGTTGIMGATAACGWLLDLSASELETAFGIAGSRAGSLSINTGTMTKSSHSGHAARMAVESVELARLGWTASRRVFDEGGFFDTFMGDRHDAQQLLRSDDSPYLIVDPGLIYKKHPSNGFTQFSIDAALIARQDPAWDSGRVRRITLSVPPLRYVDRPAPASGLDGKFSLQYTCAVALLDGAVTVDSFSDERLLGEDVQRLLSCTDVEVDDSRAPDMQNSSIGLRIELSGAQPIVVELADVAGMLGRPLSRAQQLDKLDRSADGVLEAAAVADLVRCVDGFNSQDDVSRFMATMRSAQRLATKLGGSAEAATGSSSRAEQDDLPEAP